MSYLGHALVENRNGLIAAAMVTHADGYAERDAALLMLKEKQQGRSRRITVGADKAYDTKDFVSTVRELNVTPHVTKNDKGRASNLDPENHSPARLRRQSEPAMAGREGLWLAEANRSAAPSKVARIRESGLAVRLQLRRTQPHPVAETDGSTTGNAQGAVCLSHGRGPPGVLP